MPLKKLSGIEITNAQGQDITKNTNALYNQSENSASFINNVGIATIKTASSTTIGV